MYYSKSDNQQNTPLELTRAAHNGDLERIKVLIQSGADVNTKLGYLRTPLMTTVHGCWETKCDNENVSGQHLETVDFLLQQHGIDLEFRDTSDRTALMWAVNLAHTSEAMQNIAIKLINAGAKVNIIDWSTNRSHQDLKHSNSGEHLPIIAANSKAYTVLGALLSKSNATWITETARDAVRRLNHDTFAYCIKHNADLSLKALDKYKDTNGELHPDYQSFMLKAKTIAITL